ncbi:LexA family protein [Dyadobacter luticola]|uniref:Translesion error-prone DNA polymerase V autoproteolytic subunit n=1 Tax=Dyadobacter luticola TaxID=1979387 RepID=A0A5R9L2B9_9BACT|nr:translesion error-prone DNA polymerase V autoproteolytic subunit [Dyadobacter luticola]TLV02410.1 translesion error-prone DNA polymerase V autoproteolytic subunit [Dyadobacter luticola]
MEEIFSVQSLKIYRNVASQNWLTALIPAISAGFPSPAADFIDLEIDLQKEIVKNPASTFYGKVQGTSMRDVHIDDGDIIVIDKSLPCKENCIAVCFLNGDFLVKRVRYDEGGCWLVAENDQYAPIWVGQDTDFLVWGIVTNVIKFY